MKSIPKRDYLGDPTGVSSDGFMPAPFVTLAVNLAQGIVKSEQLLKWFGVAVHVYDQARQLGGGQPNRRAYDALLAAPIPEIEPEMQCMLASLVLLQREKLRLAREITYLRLSDADRQVTLRLAAVLYLAISLDEQGISQALTRTSRGVTTLLLPNEQIGLAMTSAAAALDRWRAVVGPISVEAVPAVPPAKVVAVPPLPDLEQRFAATDTLRGTDPFAEGVRRLLRRMYEKMLAREEGVRRGEDPDDVHQMRVAIRRLRASLQIVAPLFDSDAIREYRRGLRQIATALGYIRDADVLLGRLVDLRDSIEADGASLDSLVRAVQQQRVKARVRLLTAFDERRYSRFKREFARFLTTPGQDVLATAFTGEPLRVRDVAGSLIYRCYEDLRSFETVVPHGPEDTLHQARIVGKRLRYVLELLSEPLGARVQEALEPLAALQECLGFLQDMVVAQAQVEALDLVDDEGAIAYLRMQTNAWIEHKDELERLWDRINSATYRRRLFELLIKL